MAYATTDILVIKMQQSFDQTAVVMGVAIVEQDFTPEKSLPSWGKPHENEVKLLEISQ